MPAHHLKTHPLCVANARHSPSYGCALRLDRACFGALLGHVRKTPSLCETERLSPTPEKRAVSDARVAQPGGLSAKRFSVRRTAPWLYFCIDSNVVNTEKR